MTVTASLRAACGALATQFVDPASDPVEAAVAADRIGGEDAFYGRPAEWPAEKFAGKAGWQDRRVRATMAVVLLPRRAVMAAACVAVVVFAGTALTATASAGTARQSAQALALDRGPMRIAYEGPPA